jgi:hypothetical protein
MDGFKEDGYYEQQDLSMGSHYITDLLDGVNDQDAATVAQLAENLTTAESYATAASSSADEASDSAEEALASEELALSYSTSAATSATEAAASAATAEENTAAITDMYNRNWIIS